MAIYSSFFESIRKFANITSDVIINPYCGSLTINLSIFVLNSYFEVFHQFGI